MVAGNVVVDLNRNIERIAELTRLHAELRSAHHFLYDLRHPKNGQPKFVVMGVNPGETKHDWEVAPQPTEETSRYDFHNEVGSGRSAVRWTKAARFFLDDADYVLAELFFWSSYDSRQFVERFGPMASSPHLAFCTKLNQELIDAHQPIAVVLPGLSHLKLAASQYGLSAVSQVKTGGVRVAEIMTDGERPWVFTKHWTAAFGFSQAQRVAAREAIRDAAG